MSVIRVAPLRVQINYCSPIDNNGQIEVSFGVNHEQETYSHARRLDEKVLFRSAKAANAVDGVTSTVATTTKQDKPWVMVDLGALRMVDVVSFSGGIQDGLKVQVCTSASAGCTVYTAIHKGGGMYYVDVSKNIRYVKVFRDKNAVQLVVDDLMVLKR